jgi:hypothetical protein
MAVTAPHDAINSGMSSDRPDNQQVANTNRIEQGGLQWNREETTKNIPSRDVGF